MTSSQDHNMSAMQRVLQNPDLLTMVFDTFVREDSKHKGESLAVAARVNRTWFALATSVLWGQLSYPFHEDTARVLVTIAQTRRQHYASRMRVLNISERRASSMHASFKGIHFPLLKHLTLPLSCEIHDHQAGSIQLYLQPMLESLSVYDGGEYLNDEFVAHIMQHCPHLKAVLLWSPGTNLSVQALSRLFTATKHVEEVSLRFEDSDRLISSDPLLQLSELPKLKIVKIISPLTSPGTLDFVRMHNPHPFQTLHTLDLCVDTSTASAAALLFPNVQDLVLRVHGADSSFFKDVASMQKLTTLVITITGRLQFEVDDVLALTSLHYLETLVFSGDEYLHAIGFTDSEFDYFCSSLPSIRHLDLEPLSDHCPELSYLNLHNGSCNFALLGEVPGPLFPKMKTIILNAEEPEQENEGLAIMIGRLMDWHAPQLEDLQLGESEFANIIEEVWLEARSERP
ncbi:hypothetical protein E4T39_01073 [Aureobasidium subglaciale]|nr:hypothetical protein E4T39_01073 [Aureobasidium subglaciale]